MWDKQWDQVYSSREWGKYPGEQVIRFVAKYFSKSPERHEIKILEIGCGTGTNLWFLSREGYDAYGIDGSSHGLKIAQARLASENLSATVSKGDIAKLDYPDNFFDAVIDIAAIIHNTLEDAQSIVGEAYRVLKPGGRMFSELFAPGGFGADSGSPLGKNTFRAIAHGPFSGVGLIRFYDREELAYLFENFSGLSIDYETRSLLNGTENYTMWLVTGEKKLSL